ncbi:hypothetical protein C8R44DRAFT_741402 [Mycena epipterygia]|nr:hypothetical protein C8R44DRAFT_741402 [Mycena epipterygia]
MPAGRPPLDPKVKHEHVNASRKRYDEKNIEKRREDARLRMQRKRAAIAASDFKTRWRYREKAASDSERYRDRKNAELRTEAARADAVKRKMEAKELRKQSLKKHAEKPTAATPTAVPSSKKARRLTRLQSERGAAPEQNDLANEDSDDELRACRVPAPATFEGGITARTRSVVSLRSYSAPPSTCPTLATKTSTCTKGRSSQLCPKIGRVSLLLIAPPPPSPPKASLRERQRQRNALHSEFLAAEDARIAKEAAEKLSKDDLAFLAGFRPGPGQISPQRANQLFTRVLGLRGAAPPWLQHPIEHGNEPPALIHEDGRSAAASRADMEGLGEGAPVLYAVSGRSRVFQDRDRAVAVLKRTPGAELMFSRDEGEVWDFLGEDPTLNLNI